SLVLSYGHAYTRALPSFPTRRSSDLPDDVALKIPVDEYEAPTIAAALELAAGRATELGDAARAYVRREHDLGRVADAYVRALERSEEHTSELQSLTNLVCRLLLEKKK